MNPDAGAWALELTGVEMNLNRCVHVLSLQQMVRLLTPEYSHMLENQHDAGVDAQMARLVYMALLERALPYLKANPEAPVRTAP